MKNEILVVLLNCGVQQKTERKATTGILVHSPPPQLTLEFRLKKSSSDSEVDNREEWIGLSLSCVVYLCIVLLLCIVNDN